MRTGHLPSREVANTYSLAMPKPPTSPAERAPVRARPRRHLLLLALTAVALPLVAFAPAGATVDAPDQATVTIPVPSAPSVPSATPWQVTVLEGDRVVRAVTSARTVDEMLDDLGIVRGPLDRVEAVPDRRAAGPTPLRLVRVELDVERREVALPLDVARIDDLERLRGFIEVVSEGSPGLSVVTDLVLRVDGEVESRLTVDTLVIRPSIARIERVGTREVQGASVWDALARCEASGRWDAVRHVNDELSYHGGLQFDPRTWDAFRPSAFPILASQASREQQITVAERVLEAQGWGAWPACSARLGLR